jgi:PAS domain-containing protein
MLDAMRMHAAGRWEPLRKPGGEIAGGIGRGTAPDIVETLVQCLAAGLAGIEAYTREIALAAADFIKRRKIDVALRESEERLRTAAEAGRMVYWTCNLETSVVAAPETMANPPGRLVGQRRGGCSYGTAGARIGDAVRPGRCRMSVPE